MNLYEYIPEFIWIYMNLYEFIWFYMKSCGIYMIYMKSMWNHMKSCEIWYLYDLYAFICFYMVLYGSIGPHRNSPSRARAGSDGGPRPDSLTTRARTRDLTAASSISTAGCDVAKTMGLLRYMWFCSCFHIVLACVKISLISNQFWSILIHLKWF